MTGIGYLGVLLEGTQRIVIDAGMGKFKLLKGDDPTDYWEVPDLRKWSLFQPNIFIYCLYTNRNLTVDGALVLLDLSQDFGVENAGNHMTVIPREKLDTGISYIPVVNRGYMWQDSLENIYTSGGHFFSQPWPGA